MFVASAVQVAVVRESSFYKWLWDKFKEFASSVCARLRWPVWSGKMELTIHRKNPHNLVHFHLCATDPEKRHKLRNSQTVNWLHNRDALWTYCLLAQVLCV